MFSYFNIQIWFLQIYLFFYMLYSDFQIWFCRSTYSSTCSILIFKFGICKIVCGVGASLNIWSSLIFSSSFYRLSFKPIFCKKSFKLDLPSFTFIGKYVVFNITSLKPKNFKQSCNCSSTLALRNDRLKKYYKD
jgi:hypothetical protein